MGNWKIGDFVECIDNKGVENFIQNGEIYEIEYIIKGLYRENFLHLKGIIGPFALNSGRFIKANVNTKLGELF